MNKLCVLHKLQYTTVLSRLSSHITENKEHVKLIFCEFQLNISLCYYLLLFKYTYIYVPSQFSKGLIRILIVVTVLYVRFLLYRH